MSQNEFDNDYGTMSINPGRSLQDFDFDELDGIESNTENKTTTRVSITSLLWYELHSLFKEIKGIFSAFESQYVETNRAVAGTLIGRVQKVSVSQPFRFV